MKDDVRPVPDWLLERLVRGDLPAAEAAQVRGRLEVEGEAGRARLAALEQSDREILAALPSAQVAAEVERRAKVRLPRKAASPWRLAIPTLTLGLAAAGALILVRPAPLATDGASEAEHTTSKGLPPSIAVFRKRDGSGTPPERLNRGSAVRAGDTLQLAYVSAGRRYGVIASVDAQGTVTLHLPEAPGEAPALVAHGETALPHAYQLDETPGFERFVFFTSDSPFATEPVVEALRKGSALPAGLVSVDLTLHKESP